MRHVEGADLPGEKPSAVIPSVASAWAHCTVQALSILPCLEGVVWAGNQAAWSVVSIIHRQHTLTLEVERTRR